MRPKAEIRLNNNTWCVYLWKGGKIIESAYNFDDPEDAADWADKRIKKHEEAKKLERRLNKGRWFSWLKT